MSPLGWLLVAYVVGLAFTLALVAGAGRLERQRREAQRRQR